MTTSASTKRYMGCKIARSVIARISDKTISTRATICQGRAMFLLPVKRVDPCSEYQIHRFINHCQYTSCSFIFGLSDMLPGGCAHGCVWQPGFRGSAVNGA